MEVEEEDEELGELCAEILENWNSPGYSDSAHTSLHQNPFSLHHYQPLNPAYHQTVKEQRRCATHPIASNVTQLSLHASQSDQVAKISTSKPIHEDPKHDFELENKQRIIKKAIKPTYGKGSKYQEKSSTNAGMDRSIIPVLVADTFFDRVLGNAVDGIDIAALINLNKTKGCVNDAGASTFSANNGKEIEKLNYSHMSSSFKCDFPMANRLPKRSGEYGCTPATSTTLPIVIRSSFQRDFVAKCRYVPPPNKTILDVNIDDFTKKMWRKTSADMSDFFNYGLDEKRWKDYCKLMQPQIQVRRFGQSKIGQSKIIKDESRQSLKVELTGSNEMGKQQSSGKQREHSLSHIDQRNQKRVRFYPANQKIHNKVDLNFAESLCCPRVGSIREKIENYVSDGAGKEPSSRIVPSNSHSSDIQMEVEDLMHKNNEADLAKLKRRRERFKLTFANSEE